MGLWVDVLVILSVIGYSFVVANASIGLNNIRDLNRMKGNIPIIRAHKLFGRIETFFFIAILVQCIMMMVQFGGIDAPKFYDYSSGRPGLHVMIGGFIATVLFLVKVVIATFFKNTIYKIGQYVGPIGFVGWSLSHWTSIINYYFIKSYEPIPELAFFLNSGNFWLISILPFLIGMILFLVVKVSAGEIGKGKFSQHQIAFILHGVTFGYEKATKELLGTPALFKYVVPKTYAFLDKMMESFGIDMKKLERMNLNDAMDEFMKRSSEIGMAEKIKIKWISDREFTVESINCSTASVRSYMDKEELENVICPWAIMSASVVAKITGKELDIEPSEFNEIGAVTKLKIKE